MLVVRLELKCHLHGKSSPLSRITDCDSFYDVLYLHCFSVPAHGIELGWGSVHCSDVAIQGRQVRGRVCFFTVSTSVLKWPNIASLSVEMILNGSLREKLI